MLLVNYERGVNVRPIRRRLNALEWDAIKDMYRSGNYSANDIAIKYGVSTSTIKKKASTNKWRAGECPIVKNYSDVADILSNGSHKKFLDEAMKDRTILSNVVTGIATDMLLLQQQIIKGTWDKLIKCEINELDAMKVLQMANSTFTTTNTILRLRPSVDDDDNVTVGVNPTAKTKPPKTTSTALKIPVIEAVDDDL